MNMSDLKKRIAQLVCQHRTSSDTGRTLTVDPVPCPEAFAWASFKFKHIGGRTLRPTHPVSRTVKKAMVNSLSDGGSDAVGETTRAGAAGMTREGWSGMSGRAGVLGVGGV